MSQCDDGHSAWQYLLPVLHINLYIECYECSLDFIRAMSVACFDDGRSEWHHLLPVLHINLYMQSSFDFIGAFGLQP